MPPRPTREPTTEPAWEPPISHSLFLLGEGIGASRAPALHEREGREQGMSVTYRLLDALVHRLGPGDLPEVVRWAKRFGVSGFNVTHPFKSQIVAHLDGLSEHAAAIGAVNTVVVRDGAAIGHNTDWSGFARALEAALPQRPRGRAVQIGAGGAGSAIAYGLLHLGFEHVTLLDLDADRARALVNRMNRLVGAGRMTVGDDLAAELERGAEGLVHATPVGMATHPGCVVPAQLLHAGLWVAEAVYFPLQTELVRRARAAGCLTVDGGGMAAGQAIEAFGLFTGRPADAARMHAHLRAMVGP